eukprot:c36864_g1_i1 orf=376-870(-)
MENFSTELYFGTASNEAGYCNLVAINASKVAQAYLLKRKLKSLLEDLENGCQLPKLCHDVAAIDLPSLTKRAHALPFVLVLLCLGRSRPSMFLHLSTVSDRYLAMFLDGTYDVNPQRFQEVLQELHNEGVLVCSQRQGKKKANGDTREHDQVIGTLTVGGPVTS